MTEVYFYILEGEQADAAMHFACRLAEKAYHSGHRVFIHVTDEAQVSAMDRLLWQFRQSSFVPHETESNQAREDDLQLSPVVIGCREPAPEFNDFLINLEGDPAPFLSRFARYNEIVGPHALKQARQQYRQLKSQGYALTTHHIRDR